MKSTTDRRFDSEPNGRRTQRIADRLLLVCAAVAAILVVAVWYRVASLPYQLDYGEGLILEGAIRVRDGLPLYPNPLGPPIVLHDFGPLAYAAASLTLPSMGASFFGGRMLVLACAFWISGCIALVLKQYQGSTKVPWAFGAFLLCVPIFRFWLPLLRADLIGIALAITGVTLYCLKPRLWMWTVPFFTAAIFCKYTLLAAPLAIIVELILKRELKKASLFIASLGGLCLALFLLLQRTSAGYFAFHMFSTHHDPYSFKKFLALMSLVWLSAPVITGLAIFHVAGTAVRNRWNFFSLYFMSACITGLSAGKLGSSTNHFLEWIVSACLCAGFGYLQIRSQHPERALVLAVAIVGSVIVGTVFQSFQMLQANPELSGCREAYRYVANSGANRILSQSLGPLLLSGKEVMVTDPFIYSELVEHGVWPDVLVPPTEHERFDLIITTVSPDETIHGAARFWPSTLTAAMKDHYRVTKGFNCRDGSLMLEPKTEALTTSHSNPAPTVVP
jgi:hypothetical protein